LVPSVVVEAQQLVLRPSDDQYAAWSRAQAIAGAPTVKAWAEETLDRTAARLADLSDLAAGKNRKQA
jgi:hypothetical protein